MTNSLHIPRVLVRTLGIQFYQESAGFLFILLAFGVGILRPIEHIYLIEAAISSPFVLSLLLTAWSMYWIKAVHFTLLKLEKADHQWMYSIVLLPKFQQFFAWGIVGITQYLLATFYIMLIVVKALYLQQWTAGVVGALLILAMHLLGIGLYIQKTCHPGAHQAISKFTLKINRQFAKPVYAWFWWALFRNHTVMLALTKLLSLGLLLISYHLYQRDTYDTRLLSVTLLAVGFLHASMMYYYHFFQHQQLSFTRNLPIPLYTIFRTHLITLLLIVLPESILLLRYFVPEAGWVIASEHILFLLSLLSLIYHSQLLDLRPMEKFVRSLFYAFILYFLMIMYGTPMSLLIIINLLVSYRLFRKSFDQFELQL